MGKNKDKKDDKKPNKIAGVKIGNKLGAGEIREIAAATGKSVAQIAGKAANKDVKVSSAARNVVSRAAAPSPPSGPGPSSGPSPSTTNVFSGGGGGFPGASVLPGEEIVNFANFDLAREGSNLEAQKQIERIRDAGATERLKYEVDNRIPEIQAESKGKLDLQAIVNAGYKNIANIERGSDMVRNITSMFNF
jgi:hypothetical protein